MSEQYMDDEKIIAAFAKKLKPAHYRYLQAEFFEDAEIFYDGDKIDGASTLGADYFKRSCYGEFSEIGEYLCALCVHIQDDVLRNRLIGEFDLDRDFIESEL